MIHGMQCCGVRELHGLSYANSPQEAFRAFQRDFRRNRRWRYAIFTQAQYPWMPDPFRAYGEEFAQFIQDHKLGTVMESSAPHAGHRRNPNTGATLRIWVWTLNHAGIKRYMAAHPLPPRR